MKVTVYTTSTCPFCDMLASYLEEKNINYEKKNVDNDKALKEEMMEKSNGFLGVPFTVIEKAGQEEFIIGFDKNKLNTILGL